MMTGDPPAELITTFLEMREHPTLQVTPPHRSGMLVRLREPVPSFYRFLLVQAGVDAADLDDSALDELIVDDAYDVYILFVGGAPAGMFELDRREPADIAAILGRIDDLGAAPNASARQR